MAIFHPEKVDADTPTTQGEIRELAQSLVAGEITADQYFAAVDRRAEWLVDEEAGHGR